MLTAPARDPGTDFESALGGHPLQLEENLAIAGEGVPVSEKDPEGWGATDKFTVILETPGLNATEPSAYFREWGLYPEQVERWRQAS